MTAKFLTISIILALSFFNALECQSIPNQSTSLSNTGLPGVILNIRTFLRAQLVQITNTLDKILTLIEVKLQENYKIDATGSVQLDKIKLKNTTHQILRIVFIQNPLLGFVVEKIVDEGINSNPPVLKDILQRCIVTIDGAKNLIKSINFSLVNRAKRSLSDTNFGQILAEFIFKIFHEQISSALIPIQKNINATLSNISESLLKYYVSVPPNGDFESVIALASNTVFKRLVEIVNLLRTSLNDVFDSFTSAANSLRKKRAVLEGSNPIVEGFNNITTFLRPIISIVFGILKNVFFGIVAVVKPIFGIVSRLVFGV